LYEGFDADYICYGELYDGDVGVEGWGESVGKVVRVRWAMNFVGVVAYLGLCSVRNEILRMEREGREVGEGGASEMVDEGKGLIGGGGMRLGSSILMTTPSRILLLRLMSKVGI
jgi:hypothetical protein